MHALGKRIQKAWFLMEGRKLYRKLDPESVDTDPVPNTKRYAFKFGLHNSSDNTQINSIYL